MNKRPFLPLICFLLLVSLLAVPVFAATVTCPDSCSCILPADAKKSGSPGYCSGKQAVCGYDTQKNEKYCYTKASTPTTTVPQMAVTTKLTTIPATPCPSTCTCIPDEKAQGAATPLTLCGKTKTYCGSTAAGIKQYCYLLPVMVTTTTPVTTTPTTLPGPVESCGAGCRCLATDKADPSGYKRCSSSAPACSFDPLGQAMYCYAVPSATMVSPVPADGTLPGISPRPPSDNAPPNVSLRPSDGPVEDAQRKTTTPLASDNAPQSFFSFVGSFFASLFGGSSPYPSSSLQPVPCSGIMTSVMTDPDNCGSCGVKCSSGSCVAGKCTDTTRRVTACGPGSVQCNGTCTYIRSDENNCGSCGHQCMNGEHCCSGSCTNLLTTENCGLCGNTCGSGLACCGRKCIDISSDRLNCGGCGHQCLGSSVCENDVCVDKTCEEALFAERKTNAELQAQLDRLSERYSELETRFNYCLWLEDYYKDGYSYYCGDHCLYPPEPTDDVPMVTDFGE